MKWVSAGANLAAAKALLLATIGSQPLCHWVEALHTACKIKWRCIWCRAGVPMVPMAEVGLALALEQDDCVIAAENFLGNIVASK